MRNLIHQSMQDQDQWVVEFSYADAKGNRTRRVVSPIRFLDGDRFLGLCLSREAPRQFHLGRCESMQIRQAHTYVMPVPMPSLN